VVWDGSFSDKDSAYSVYRQLVSAFARFYYSDLKGDAIVFIYSGSTGYMPIDLLPYYANALNEATGIVEIISFENRRTTGHAHPAFNSNGVSLELIHNEVSETYFVRVSFRLQTTQNRNAESDRYNGIIIPDGSAYLR
jgi:hypothetical protein